MAEVARGARARRAVQPAPLRRPAAGRAEPARADAGAPRRADAPSTSLKTVAISPGNAARGLDSHQGFVALFDGVTGETRAIMNAGAITAVRTAAVSGVATRAARARGHAQARDPRRRRPGALAPRGDARGARLRAGRGLEPHAGPGGRARRRRGGRERRGGRARRRRRRHRDRGARAGARARVAEARRAHQRRRLEHPDRPASSTRRRWRRRRCSSTGASRRSTRRATICSRCARARSARRTSAASSARC